MTKTGLGSKKHKAKPCENRAPVFRLKGNPPSLIRGRIYSARNKGKKKPMAYKTMGF